VTPGDDAILSFMPNGRKPGRPQSATVSLARKLHGEQSDRTRARWVRAMRMLIAAEVPQDVINRLMSQCTRPSGSFNFAKFERRADEVAAVVTVEAGRHDG
jgi:hypothetical protein